MGQTEKIRKKYQNIPDLKIRNIQFGISKVIIFYIETICSSDRVNNYILKNITNPNEKRNLENLLAAPNMQKITEDNIDNFLFSGFTIVLFQHHIYALETKADLDRSIEVPQIEPSLTGPKDSLVENYQKNIGLIKRRLKSPHLKIINYAIGRYSKTITGLLYIDNITKTEVISKTDQILKKIDNDAIIDAGELKQFLVNENKNFFPSTKMSERPDVIVEALLQGKIVIVVDNSPFAIILPAVLADFINPTIDLYGKNNNVNFLKILRSISFLITIITPAYYISLINYNQESIPAKLLTSFISQREGVPFPAIIEAFGMLLICEILRESDIRFPNSYSSSISILGALILGEAAVSASLVTPIMIIITAITFISSMIFNEVEMAGAVRAWRFIFMIFASFYGLYGVTIALIFFLTNLCSFDSFGLPYMFPIAPFNFSYFKETLIRINQKKDKKRSKFLTNNIRKQV